MKTLFYSRKFWASFLSFLVVAVSHYIPNFNLDIDELIGFAVVIASYVIGTAVDAGGGIGGIFKSRKFWAAVVGLVVVIARGFGYASEVPSEQIVTMLTIVSAYILGVAFEGKSLLDPVEVPKVIEESFNSL